MQVENTCARASLAGHLLPGAQGRGGEGACLSEGGRGGGECSRYHACIRFLPSENFALDNSPCLQFKAAGFKAEESQQVRERNGEMKVVCA